MPNEMTPELLALLTPEQQEVWRIHGIASYMPSAYVADALLELAQMKQALADAKSRLLDAQAARTIWMERSKANTAEYNVAYDAMCEIGEMLGCAEDWAAIKAALKETLGKVGELRAAVADAPHDMWCAVTFPAAPAKLMACNCWKSETK